MHDPRHPRTARPRRRDAGPAGAARVRPLAGHRDARGAPRARSRHQHAQSHPVLGQCERVHRQGPRGHRARLQAVRHALRRPPVPGLHRVEGRRLPSMGPRLLRRVPPGVRLDLPPRRQRRHSREPDEGRRSLPLPVGDAARCAEARSRRAHRAREAARARLPGRERHRGCVAGTEADQPARGRAVHHRRARPGRQVR